MDIDLCHLATRHLNSRVQQWSHKQSAMCFNIFSIVHPQAYLLQRGSVGHVVDSLY